MNLRAHREYLNQGGYTRSGRYFGLGQKLWRVSDDDGRVDTHVRASTASEARHKVAEQHGIHLAPTRKRSSRAGRSTWSIEDKIKDAQAVRSHVSPEFHPLFDHLLSLARHSAKSGYAQRAGQEVAKAKRMAAKYPAARDRSRTRRRRTRAR